MTAEVPAPAASVLSDIAVKEGDTVAVGALLGTNRRNTGAAPAGAGNAKTRRAAPHLLPPAPAKMETRDAVPPSAAQNRRRKRRRPVKQSRALGMHGRVIKGDMLGHFERRRQPGAGRTEQMRAAIVRRRRRARRTRAHDAAAPDHRAPSEGRAEHRRHAHDLQRGRHERGDADAQSIQGPIREEARRQAGLHGLLRQGVHPGAEGNSRRQCRDRRRRHRLQELLSTSALPSAPRRG